MIQNNVYTTFDPMAIIHPLFTTPSFIVGSGRYIVTAHAEDATNAVLERNDKGNYSMRYSLPHLSISLATNGNWFVTVNNTFMRTFQLNSNGTFENDVT